MHDSTAANQLNGILAAAHRLSHLVEQMLALARAEPSLAQTQPEVTLAEVVQKVAESWLPIAISKQIDLGFELAAASLHGNELLLEELLANLLDNALRHTPPGGTITVRCGIQAASVWLSIDDSGCGIAESERALVFERFYRPQGSASQGCGLGLAIVRQIARQHGGEVSINASEELGGTHVQVDFLQHKHRQ
jgi:two-component system sensor histidine kinase TctE